jgi:hypothetical protein
MTFAPNNLAEIEAMRALVKKPTVSRAEQAEIIRNHLEATVAGINEQGFRVGTDTNGNIVVRDMHE